jgi:hypothetical protein
MKRSALDMDANFLHVRYEAKRIKGAEVKVILATAVLSLSLCSCAAHNDANYRNLVGLTVVGDDQQVTVLHVRNKADGLPLADKHCKQFGKSALFNKMEGTRAVYNCQYPDNARPPSGMQP